MQTEPESATTAEKTHWQTLQQWISPGLKVFMGIGSLLLFWEGNYQAAVETLVIMGITFFPYFMDRQFRVRIPVEFEVAAVVFIFMSLFLGEVQGFYARFWWWDLVLHTGSAFLIGLTGFLLVFVMNSNPRVNMHLTPKFIALFAFMFAMGIGCLWEIFEFAMDSLFGMNMQKSGLVDTMWDLIVNTIGALTISVLGYGYLKTDAIDSFLEHMIAKFIRYNPRLFRKRKPTQSDQGTPIK